MSATDRIDYSRSAPAPTGVPNVGALPAMGHGAGAADAMAAFAAGTWGAPNPEMMMRWMAFARPSPLSGVPTPSVAPSPMGADPNFYSPMLMAMFDQMLKTRSPPAPTAPKVVPSPGVAHGPPCSGTGRSGEKYYVVRELCVSGGRSELQVAVESGPVEALDEAYAVLQHVKSRSRPETDPDQVVSLHKDVTVWSEPSAAQGFFVVQMPVHEMQALTAKARRGAGSGRMPSDGGAPSGGTDGGGRRSVRHGPPPVATGAKTGSGGHPAGQHRPPPGGGGGGAFRTMGGSPVYDRSISTSHVKAEAAASPSSSGGVHPAEDKPHHPHHHAKQHAGPVASRLAGGGIGNNELAGGRPSKPSGGGGAPRTLAEAVDAAAAAGRTGRDDSPEASDYSVNRSYHEGGAAAVAGGPTAAGGHGQQQGEGKAAEQAAGDVQDEEMDALVGMIALSKSAKGEGGGAEEHGTPPTSDGTRAYLTASSDDEFNALKNPPKRRRSTYQQQVPGQQQQPGGAAPPTQQQQQDHAAVGGAGRQHQEYGGGAVAPPAAAEAGARDAREQAATGVKEQAATGVREQAAVMLEAGAVAL